MKVGLIGAAVLAVIAAPPARACECIVEGVGAWPPPGSTIPTNGIIVLRGIQSSYQLVGYIDEHHPTLACGKRGIPLQLEDIFVGYYDVEALLVPARRLPPGARCELVLTPKGFRGGAITWIDTFDLRNVRGGTSDGLPWWTVAGTADRRPPVWIAAPQWTGRAERGDPCNTFPGDVSVKAAVQAADAEGPVLIRAVLDDGKEKNDFLLPAPTGAIELGFNLCGGAFPLEKGRRYRVTLSALDAAGHETRAPASLPLTAP